MNRFHSALASLVWASSALLSAGELPKTVDSFFGNHCVECHDDVVAKGGLNLVDLSFTPGHAANFKQWQRVFERVRDGEMPPKDKPRPNQADLAKMLDSLEPTLLKADEERIAKDGRVQSRRLTRREYEYSLHDLLGIDIPLKELLPEDPASHGFETVAEGQQLSHHNLARYLDVADLALEEAFSRALKGDAVHRKTFTPEDLAGRTRGNYRGPDLRDGKSISWPIGLQFFGRLPVTQAPDDGWYRITLKDVEAINPGPGGAVWGTLRTGTCYSDAPMLYMAGLVEATRKPQDLTFDTWMWKGHMLELRPNDFEQKKAPTGAMGGNVSFKDRDLAKEGYAGIAHRGIEMTRIYPNADRAAVIRHLFGEAPLDEWKDKPQAGLSQLVARFAARAFRRPVTAEQLAPYREIGQEALKNGESLPDALRASYRAILCSPRFLTFVESPGQLDDYAIASRLSYALWVSTPDWKLTSLAKEGQLRKPQALKAQVERMLADPKAERFIVSFTDQWLKLKEIDFTSPDTRQFRTFDPVVQESMLQETRTYIRELIEKDLGVDHLVESDHAWLNGRLARHYGTDLPLEPGKGLQRVSLPEEGRDSLRGGLVTQGAILKVTADGTTTSPVVRGVYVNERILGLHAPPPPPNVPAIEPDIRGATSIREQLDKHRSDASCAACHQKIDPPGFALENFDPVGGWRKNYGLGGKGKPVDPSGVTPDGAGFSDLAHWQRIYAERDELLAKGFASQFLTYATGAPIGFRDHKLIENVVAQAETSGHGLKSIIQAAVASPIFLQK